MAKEIRKPGYSVKHESWFLPLTQGVISLVDGKDVPVLAQKSWCALRTKRFWYAVRNTRLEDGNATLQYMHRVITEAVDRIDVDHIDHHPLDEKVIDNRRSNLRVCTRTENIRNSRPRRGGSSGFKGVYWNKRACKWMARITIDGMQKYLGYFTDHIEAARAYDAAAEKHYGNFALTNHDLGLLPDQAA